jgi:uncharacterized membrane protein (UPF0182 family)
MRGPLSVDDAAEALGTSAQTVRTMLRKGELRGERRPWGSRYVWHVSADGLQEFLAEYGRLEGGRRSARSPKPADAGAVLGLIDTATRSPAVSDADAKPECGSVTSDIIGVAEDQSIHDSRPFFLRPRGRATVMVVVLGIPLLLAHLATRTLPDVWWFEELGQLDVFRRLLLAQVELRLLVLLPVAVFVGCNLGVTLRGVSGFPRSAMAAAVVVASLAIAGLFASSAAGHWETFVLWRHRQSFGVVDPVHGRDVGYFVFSLPFEHLVSTLLLWLIGVTTGLVVLILAVRGKVSWRSRRASFEAQVQLAGLAAVFLLAMAWRLHLEQYLLELQQPSSADSDSFAGADYVDVHVRTPGLAALTFLSVALAVACVVAPFLVRRGGTRRGRVLVGVPLVVLLVATGVAWILVPALVQRFVVDPSPLLREQPFLERSIAGTREGLGLSSVGVEEYAPTHSFTAADFPDVTHALGHVQIWDNQVLGARMRQLVTDTPYFKPDDEALDVVPVDGRRRPTVVGTRELDLTAVRGKADTWTNDRLSYTHGRGVIRFSSTDTGQDRAPRLLDSGLGIREPRIYFGNFAGDTSDDADSGAAAAPTASRLAQSAWVLVDTRRPEVDAPSAAGTSQPPYHYTGSAGIPLSSLLRRAVFAMGLGSKQLLLSHDITPESRILLHRDVHDRLHTLAPFIDWDTSAVPLTTDGHVVFVVDGYTTSTNYPYAERVDLGGAQVNYARPSVRATVDAFTGDVDIYLTDPDDPLARAWAEAFPSLFRPAGAMPSALSSRLRYPSELFDAQATAYERFHTSDPSVFASDSDAWSRPIALSGPIEVAGGVDFDASDEDGLDLTMRPAYSYSAPPGQSGNRLVLSTYYSPRSGQNLVATLHGWIDSDGRPQLSAMSLPRDPVTLGPAQISRQVFSTPRVSHLLGLRNLEIRDVDSSSLDSVILGRPHLLFLSGGVMQIQSLYEGSRGPGAARLLGVTAYIDGRAGLGPDIDSAVRQALNEPPQVTVPQLRGPVTVGDHVTIQFDVENAQQETVTVESPDGRQSMHDDVVTGPGSVTWVPTVEGHSKVVVQVEGLDGTEVTQSISVQVLGDPPAVDLLRAPAHAVVGKLVHIPFRITQSHQALATVSTRSGIIFKRRFDLPHGRGVLDWTPDTAGRATITVEASGEQRQTASAMVRLKVRAATSTVAPPTVELLEVPDHPSVGVAGGYALRAGGCSTAIARIEGAGLEPQTWSFPCPVQDATFTWTPTAPGSYVLRTLARAPDGVTTSQRAPLTVVAAPVSDPSSSASPEPSSTPSPTTSPPSSPTPSPTPSLPMSSPPAPVRRLVPAHEER